MGLINDKLLELRLVEEGYDISKAEVISDEDVGKIIANDLMPERILNTRLILPLIVSSYREIKLFYDRLSVHMKGEEPYIIRSAGAYGVNFDAYGNFIDAKTPIVNSAYHLRNKGEFKAIVEKQTEWLSIWLRNQQDGNNSTRIDFRLGMGEHILLPENVGKNEKTYMHAIDEMCKRFGFSEHRFNSNLEGWQGINDEGTKIRAWHMKKTVNVVSGYGIEFGLKNIKDNINTISQISGLREKYRFDVASIYSRGMDICIRFGQNDNISGPYRLLEQVFQKTV